MELAISISNIKDIIAPAICAPKEAVILTILATGHSNGLFAITRNNVTFNNRNEANVLQFNLKRLYVMLVSIQLFNLNHLSQFQIPFLRGKGSETGSGEEC